MIKQWAQRFFQWFCHPDYYPEIQGDLEEMYQRNLILGKFKAQWKYFLQVLGLFRPSLMRSFSKFSLTNSSMFRNYFKIGIRNLLRYKFYTAINISGLAIGLAAFLLINEYIRFEESYDRFYRHSEQIYRVSLMQIVNGEVVTREATNYFPTAKAFKDDLPEVQEAASTQKFGMLIFRKGASLVKENEVISADSNFLKIFDYQILQGSAEDMLKEPNSLVLTKSKAEFYFGDQNPIGETLEILGSFSRSFKVTGVIEDVPENTQYKFNMLISNSTLQSQIDQDGWRMSNYYTFLKLAPSTSEESITEKLKSLTKKYLNPDAQEVFTLIPVQDIHLNSDFQYEAEIPGSKKAVSFMRIISFFILVVAWINYINLSTARAINRAKEVGLRKVVGAQKSQLVGQFLLEAMLVNFLAALIGLLIAEFSLPYFHQLIGRELFSGVWNNIHFLKNLGIFFIAGTLISGFYPALVLSGFKPVAVLKGKFRNSRSGKVLRKGLVVMQFTTSIVLIAGTFIVYNQLQFMLGKDLGISTNYVVGVPMPSVQSDTWKAYQSKFESFTDLLRQHASIAVVGGTTSLPGGDYGDIGYTTTKVRIVGLTDLTPGSTYLQNIDDHFLEALNMKLLAGRNFDRYRIADSMVVMVNQAFLRKFNIADEQLVIHEKVQFGEKGGQREIIGVIKDFNRTSLRSDVEPTIYYPTYTPPNLVLKLKPGTYQEALAFLDKTWKEFFPDTPFEYAFLDDRFAALYAQDQRFGKIFGTFSLLAIFIATLGLFGLSSFMAIQRTVEVGVRKVLGASVSGIIGIFLQDFLILLALAGLLGIPTVYFGMNFWLENYVYRIDFPWLLCVVALLIVALFALLTIGYQTYKVAILNPAKTLKYE